MRLMLKHKAIKCKALVLTFDDGPGSRLTPAILELLAEKKAKATFFLLGRNIVGREEIVKQIAAGGHEICSHGYDHLHYWKVSPIRAIKDIKRGWAMIDTVLNIKGGKYAFRPPYGKQNIFSLLYLWISRVPIIFWSVDLGDTWMSHVEPHKIVALAKKNGGAMLLAHDFDRPDDSVDNLVLESVRQVVAMAQENAMQILTCSGLLGYSKRSV